MAAKIKNTHSILRRRQVEKRVGLTRSPLYARIKDGTFPKPIRLGNGRAVGWIEAEIDAWLDEQIEKSRKA
ncbi:MAG: helix-turn-helix transcriptional regulator [Thiobacillus sp.]|mgnify:CR=1 FL=1